MCVTRPWPSMIRGVWGDEERFVKNHTLVMLKKMVKQYILQVMVLFMMKMVILLLQVELMMLSMFQWSQNGNS